MATPHKVDFHCHILPERWPDLKEVRYTLLVGVLYNNYLCINGCSAMAMAAGCSYSITAQARPG